MARNTSNNAVKAPPKPQPLAIQILFLPWTITKRLGGGLFLALLTSILIEWVGMSFWWDDTHAKTMFLNEYALIKNDFSFSMIGSPPITLVNQAINNVMQWNSDSWMMRYLFSPMTGSELGFFANVKSGIHLFMGYFNAAGYVILTALMRVLIFFLSLPWFFLCALVGLVDGLIEREVRKFEGGIEHGYVHHLAKAHLPLMITLGWIIYLGLPFAVHPSIILIPAGIGFGWSLYVTAWSLKKFL